MILATQTGWLIAVDLIRETPKAQIVKASDEKRERRVSRTDPKQKLFDSVDDALRWQGISYDEPECESSPTQPVC